MKNLNTSNLPFLILVAIEKFLNLHSSKINFIVIVLFDQCLLIDHIVLFVQKLLQCHHRSLKSSGR